MTVKAEGKAAHVISIDDEFRHAIPARMRDARRWLVWLAKGPGKAGTKPRKVPHYVSGKCRGATDTEDDRRNLATFDEAIKSLKTGHWTGLGFALGKDGDKCWQGIDVDDIPASPERQRIVEQLPSYVELSPSGNGAHAIGYGEEFESMGANGSGVECYCGGRFFTVTGNVLKVGPLIDLRTTVQGLSSFHGKKASEQKLNSNFPSDQDYDFENIVSPTTIEELRQALKFVDHDDRQVWVRMGHALKCVPEAGLDLWLEYSRRSDKYDEDEALRIWKSFQPNRTGYPAVFVEAKRNPQFRSSKITCVAREKAGELRTSIPGVAGEGGRFRVQPAAEFAALSRQDFLIKGLLPRNALAVIYGAPASGKSFLAFDMAVAVARGKEWCGRRVHQMKVVFVAAEGAAGMRVRLLAYAKSELLDLNGLDVGFIPAAPDLLKGDEVAVALAIEQSGGAGLVVIDTLAQSTPGADENSSVEMGAALAACRLIADSTGATVLLVHHAGKTAGKGPRGWSGILAAADTVVEVARESGVRSAQLVKQKDGEDGQRFEFSLRQVELGTDEDGDPVTSCVVEHSAPTQGPCYRLTGLNEIAIYQTAKALLDGVLEWATQSAVLTQALRSLPAQTDPGRAKRDRRPEVLRRAFKELVDRGIFCMDGDNVVSIATCHVYAT